MEELGRKHTIMTSLVDIIYRLLGSLRLLPAASCRRIHGSFDSVCRAVRFSIRITRMCFCAAQYFLIGMKLFTNG